MINLNDLKGKWYINKSNFPMWLKGDKASPTLNYSILIKEGETILVDQVRYLKNGRKKTINGFDTVVTADNSEFIWRGKGLLRFLKSKWKILYLAPNKKWAIIYFEKSLFTPKGYDVISREKVLDNAMEDNIKEKLDQLGVKEKLTTIPQQQP